MTTRYPIYFFIPPALWPNEMPSSPDENWAGFGLGLYTWTIQTYLRLSNAGVNCQLTSNLPSEGIVLCHSNALRSVELPLAPKRFVICMKAEAPLSAIAPMHVVQNPTEASLAGDRYYIPHWPQPNLIPRDPARENRFENIAFFGHQASLAPELQSHAWQVALAERGLNGRAISNTNSWNNYATIDTAWNDYHNIDAIVAVRSFSALRRIVTRGFANKPATKLFNAWLSGVIPILGAESAYRETGKSGQDYIEVESFLGLLESLERLKANPDARQSFRAAGRNRAEAFTPEKIVTKWQIFLELVAIPAYVRWCDYTVSQQRQALLIARASSLIDKAKRRGQHLLLRGRP
ncbi:MAG: glycosyltransferase [Cyanobacteria bacterium J06632_3]